MSLLAWLDASAVVKLIVAETESPALRLWLTDADPLTSELTLVEVPRAIRRAAADHDLPLARLLARADEVLGALALLPLDRDVLRAAGALPTAGLRALDAIHVAGALSSGAEVFVGYDERQNAAARLAGLRTVSPGRA